MLHRLPAWLALLALPVLVITPARKIVTSLKRERRAFPSLALQACEVLSRRGNTAQPPAAGDAAKAIRAVLDAQVAAWNKGDLEGFMAGYWKSPELTFYSGRTKLRGWQATLDRYRKRYQADGRAMGQLAFSELEIEPLGKDHALVRGRWQVTLKTERPSGLFTLVLKRLPEGWRIIHDHTSSS